MHLTRVTAKIGIQNLIIWGKCSSCHIEITLTKDKGKVPKKYVKGKQLTNVSFLYVCVGRKC